MGGIYLKCNC